MAKTQHRDFFDGLGCNLRPTVAMGKLVFLYQNVSFEITLSTYTPFSVKTIICHLSSASNRKRAKHNVLSFMTLDTKGWPILYFFHPKRVLISSVKNNPAIDQLRGLCMWGRLHAILTGLQALTLSTRHIKSPSKLEGRNEATFHVLNTDWFSHLGTAGTQ